MLADAIVKSQMEQVARHGGDVHQLLPEQVAVFY
jgi:phosphopantetheine adenylyltransferase